MVQPKQPPLSIRPGPDRLAKVQAWATDHGLSQHAAILALIDLGLSGPVALTPPSPGPSPITTRLNAAERATANFLAVEPAIRMLLPKAEPGSRLKKGKTK